MLMVFALAILSVCVMFLLSLCGPIDRPVARSSHKIPVTRAGGLGLLWVFCSLIALKLSGELTVLDGHLNSPQHTLNGFVFLAFLMAVMFGLFDDIFGLTVKGKLIFQGLCGGLLCVAAYQANHLKLAFPEGGLYVTGIVAVLVFLTLCVGLMNVVNFMDGANGMVLLTSLIIFAFIYESQREIWVLGLLFACALLLIWNIFGRLFLGDCGSQALGVCFAALCANEIGGNYGLVFVIMGLAPFLTDTALTVFVRVLRRENIFQAHREHVYQLAIRAGSPHISVSAFYAALSVLGCSLITFVPAGTLHDIYILFMIGLWASVLSVCWCVVRRIYVRRFAAL